LKPQIISFHCILKSATGKIISNTFNNEVITAPSVGNRDELPGLAKKLDNLRSGEKRKINLDATEAYGLYNPKLVVRMPRKKITAVGELKLGDTVYLPRNEREHLPYTIVEISRDEYTLDGNHPLAGQDLVFEIEVLAAREATENEIQESTTESRSGWLH
jgi:FKBP-type peptidyl-prolyl cis-trans isomerase SlyD